MKTSIPKLHSIKWKNGLKAENVHIMNHSGDTPVDEVLRGAWQADLREITLVGYHKDGSEYVAGSSADRSKAIYALARGQFFLLGGK